MFIIDLKSKSAFKNVRIIVINEDMECENIMDSFVFYSVTVQSIRAEIPFSSNGFTCNPASSSLSALMILLEGKIAILANLPCDLSGDRTGVS